MGQSDMPHAPMRREPRLPGVRSEWRPYLGDRIIPLPDRGMPHRPVAAKFPALFVADHESNVDALARNITTMKSIPSVGVLPPLG